MENPNDSQNMGSMEEMFLSFQQNIDEDQELREDIRVIVRDLEQKAREVLAILQSIHQPGNIKNVTAICEKATSAFSIIKDRYSALAQKVPKNQYFRFHDHWRFTTQRVCFVAALTMYLQSEKLITREEVYELFGLEMKREDGFHLDLDDYLMGILQMASELARLSVSAVTAEDYLRPACIAKFIGELDSGFRLLNLKNDSLRKRYDGLKYDLQKIEGVVYDIKIRKLMPPETTLHTESEGATGGVQ